MSGNVSLGIASVEFGDFEFNDEEVSDEEVVEQENQVALRIAEQAKKNLKEQADACIHVCVPIVTAPCIAPITNRSPAPVKVIVDGCINSRICDLCKKVVYKSIDKYIDNQNAVVDCSINSTKPILDSIKSIFNKS